MTFLGMAGGVKVRQVPHLTEEKLGAIHGQETGFSRDTGAVRPLVLCEAWRSHVEWPLYSSAS